MSLDVPASPSGAPTPPGPQDGDTGTRLVADASPMAAAAAGIRPRAGSAQKVTRVVSPTIPWRPRLREIWLSRELLIYLVRT